MNCSAHQCPREAVLVVHKPGKEPMPMCLPCACKALHVADVMGFELQASPLAVAERAAARAVRDAMLPRETPSQEHVEPIEGWGKS